MTREEMHRIISRALYKAQMEYRRLQPDAARDECWSELQALEDVLEELAEPATN